MKNFSKLIIPFVVLALSSCTTTNIAVLGSYNYNESSRYVELTENYDFSSKEISSFSIDYISGYINITQEGDEFKMYEKQLDSKKFFPCYYLVENNSVDIKFVKNGTTNEEMKYLQKEIYITIPTSFSSIDIDVVSSSINASNIEIENLNIDSVGGDTTISKIKFNNINLNSVGGSLTIREVTSTSTCYLNMDTTGGNLEVGIKEELGYKVSFDTVGGAFSSDFNSKEYGNKLLNIDFDSVGGNCKIKKVNG